MDAQVTNIVEGAVARVSGIKNIRSSSEENNFRIHLEFSPEIDLDTAAADVREAVNQVQRELPDDIEQLSVVKAEDDAQPIINIAVTSESLREEELSLIIEKDIVPALIAIPGVADVPLFGQRQRILRVVLDPLRLTSFNLSVAEVAAVLDLAPLDVPSGSFRSADQELLVRTDASAVTEEQVRDIIISGTTRIGDVAHVAFGPEDAESLVFLNRQPVIGMGIVRQAQSNTIAISDRVQDTVAARYGFLVTSHKHEMYGVCAKCQSAEKRRGASRTPRARPRRACCTPWRATTATPTCASCSSSRRCTRRRSRAASSRPRPRRASMPSPPSRSPSSARSRPPTRSTSRPSAASTSRTSS